MHAKVLRYSDTRELILTLCSEVTAEHLNIANETMPQPPEYAENAVIYEVFLRFRPLA